MLVKGRKEIKMKKERQILKYTEKCKVWRMDRKINLQRCGSKKREIEKEKRWWGKEGGGGGGLSGF